MSGTCFKGKKKKERKTDRKKAFVKWSCSHYFDIEVGGNDNGTRVSSKICTPYLPQMRVEARGTDFHGTVSAQMV